MQEGRECRPWERLGWRYHDEALSQAGAGQEVDDTQSLGEPQVSEGRRLQHDGVRRGWPHGQLPLKACWTPHWLSRGQASFRGQPLVQVRQLLGHSGQGLRLLSRRYPQGRWPCPGLCLSSRDPRESTARAVEEGRAGLDPHLPPSGECQ